MKTLVNKRKHSHVPCPYKRQHLESNSPEKITKPQLFSYDQACAILQAIEMNGRKRLSKKCLACLAVSVAQAWEDKPSLEKIQQLYYMMNNLLDTTGMDPNESFQTSLQKFCSSPISTPNICPSVTLLIAISYVERLNKRYRSLKGTPGCGSRMIMVAFIMASKYIHDSLRLIIYTNTRKPVSIVAPITPPTSPKMPADSPKSVINSIQSCLTRNATATNNINNNNDSTLPSNDIINVQKDESSTTPTTNTTNTSNISDNDRNVRIARMEQEFLFFLNYDLSVNDPLLLVKWAQSYQSSDEAKLEAEEAYTSADEGDDEMDEE